MKIQKLLKRRIERSRESRKILPYYNVDLGYYRNRDLVSESESCITIRSCFGTMVLFKPSTLS